MMFRNETRHWTISTGRHFQNGHHNIAKIQHCPNSTSFHMWVDYYVPNWFLTLKNFYWSLFSKWPHFWNQFRTLLSTHISNFDDIGQCWIFAILWRSFWKWQPVEIVQCRDSIRDIIIYPHIKLWWYRTMDVLNWFSTLNNFYRSPFSKCITKIQHCPISSQFDMWVDNDVPNWFPTLKIDPPTTGLKNKIKATFEIEQCRIFVVLWWPFWKWHPVEIVQCRESIQDIIIYPRFQRHFILGRLWCPELIPDIEKFLPVAIFKMATTISQKINIVRHHHNLICW
jgi:hypothetical protein